MANHVDQAVSGLKKCEEYITAGLTTTQEFATDHLELDPDNAVNGIDEYRAMLKDYVEMDHELKSLVASVENVKRLVASGTIKSSDVKDKLEDLYEQDKKKQGLVKTSDAYRALERSIATAKAGGSAPEVQIEEGEELVFQEETQLFKCPYTGKEMVDPVKNTHCGHSYDKEGIMMYIKQRGKRAKCPFSGCLNQSFITQSCLVPDKKLRKEMEKRNKQCNS